MLNDWRIPTAVLDSKVSPTSNWFPFKVVLKRGKSSSLITLPIDAEL